MYMSKASTTPDHPRRTGQFRVERWRSKMLPLKSKKMGGCARVHPGVLRDPSQKSEPRRQVCASFATRCVHLEVNDAGTVVNCVVLDVHVACVYHA